MAAKKGGLTAAEAVLAEMMLAREMAGEVWGERDETAGPRDGAAAMQGETGGGGGKVAGLVAGKVPRVAGGRRGRPRVGEGARAVSVTIEAGLLERVDCVAREMGVTRSQLVARGLEGVLTRD